MAIEDYKYTKELEVTSDGDSTSFDWPLPIRRIVPGDHNDTGTGDIKIDWTDIRSKKDIAVFDGDENAVDYYIEYFNVMRGNTIDLEDFESGFGGWSNDPNNDFDWDRHDGPTPSDDTGPLAAYSGDYYIYIEGTDINDGDVAIIEYDIGSSKDGYVDFWYFQDGPACGLLYLQGYDGSDWVDIWKNVEGDRITQWFHVSKDETQFTGISKLRFRYECIDDDFHQDIALDHIRIVEDSDDIIEEETEAVIWVDKSLTRDGSEKLILAYGNGPEDNSVRGEELFGGNSDVRFAALFTETDFTLRLWEDFSKHHRRGWVEDALSSPYPNRPTPVGLGLGFYGQYAEDNRGTQFPQILTAKTGDEPVLTDDGFVAFAGVRVFSDKGPDFEHLFLQSDDEEGASGDYIRWYTRRHLSDDKHAVYVNQGTTEVPATGSDLHDNEWHTLGLLRTSGESATYGLSEDNSTVDSGGGDSVGDDPQYIFIGGDPDDSSDMNELVGEVSYIYVISAELSPEQRDLFHDAVKPDQTLFDQKAAKSNIIVTTNEPESISNTEATLSGTLVDLGGNSSLDVYFEWGTDTSYGNTTSTESLSSAPQDFTATIDELDPIEEYHYRAVATDGNDSWHSEDVVFRPAEIIHSVDADSGWDSGTLTDVEAKDDKLVLKNDPIKQTEVDYSGEDYGTYSGNFHHWVLKCESDYSGNLIVCPIREEGWKTDVAIEFGRYYESDDDYTILKRVTGKKGDKETVIPDVELSWHDKYYVGHDGEGDDSRYGSDLSPSDEGQYLTVLSDNSRFVDLGDNHSSRSYGFSKIKVELPSYPSSGDRVEQIDLSDMEFAGESRVEWSADTPSDTSVKVETRRSLDGGSTWSSWTELSNGDSIPDIKGEDTTNGLLEIRQTLSTSDSEKTPELSKLSVYIAKSPGNIARGTGYNHSVGSGAVYTTYSVNGVGHTYAVGSGSISHITRPVSSTGYTQSVGSGTIIAGRTASGQGYTHSFGTGQIKARTHIEASTGYTHSFGFGNVRRTGVSSGHTYSVGYGSAKMRAHVSGNGYTQSFGTGQAIRAVYISGTGYSHSYGSGLANAVFYIKSAGYTHSVGEGIAGVQFTVQGEGYTHSISDPNSRVHRSFSVEGNGRVYSIALVAGVKIGNRWFQQQELSHDNEWGTKYNLNTDAWDTKYSQAQSTWGKKY